MADKWDATKFGGSIKHNIVNPDLIEERAKSNFDKNELAPFVLGKILEIQKDVHEAVKAEPKLQ